MTSLQPVERLLLDFLAIPSVSGSEREFARALCQRLTPHFTIQRIPVDEGRFCILASHGTPKKLFVAHMDTVIGNVAVRFDEQRIFGRGSCDTKGSLAAMMCALTKAVADGVTDLGLLCTIGEETTFDGAIVASQWLKDQNIFPTRVIIGEPTHLQAVTGQRGVLCLEICCEGVEEHSSTDHPDSAIHTLVSLLHALQTMTLPDTTMNIGLISGGTAENVVAGHATATIVWRSLFRDIRIRIQEKLERLCIPHKSVVKKELPPVNHASNEFSQNIVSYFTEMFFFEQSIVLGPGGIEDAHTPYESISREELRKAVDVYSSLMSS